jgi:hypothetical protein
MDYPHLIIKKSSFCEKGGAKTLGFYWLAGTGLI